ncbi:MAG: DNA polymerase Y family protein [Myxococcales bacterium]|nr:DNA polymerase Y family protein [Myxococcales bacterium]
MQVVEDEERDEQTTNEGGTVGQHVDLPQREDEQRHDHAELEQRHHVGPPHERVAQALLDCGQPGGLRHASTTRSLRLGDGVGRRHVGHSVRHRERDAGTVPSLAQDDRYRAFSAPPLADPAWLDSSRALLSCSVNMSGSVDRTACIDVPALPLQLLLRREPAWVDAAVVVVTDDRPQAEVLWVNEAASRSRIRPGMSYAAAQSLDAKVRAGVVGPEELDERIDEIVDRLKGFSPRIEAAGRPRTPLEEVEGAPGTFWLDPSGMVPLFTSFEHWGHAIRQALDAMGLRATVVVGFHRFRCRALARVRHGVWVLEDPAIERKAAGEVPLRALTLPAKLRVGLDRLEIRTLGQLLALPAPDLRARFGEAAAYLHTCFSDGWTPLRPKVLVDPVRTTKQIEPPDDDRVRLVFLIKSMLHDLMVELADRGQAMTALLLHLHLEHAEPHEERLEPARPTLDEPIVIDLVRLRLDATTLSSPVREIELELCGVKASSGQLALFRTQARRDLDAAERALARLRAWLGPEAVTRSRLRERHLPETSFDWEAISTVGFADPKVVGNPLEQELPKVEPAHLVRRLLSHPLPLPPLPTQEPEAWLAPPEAMHSMLGPYRVLAEWWMTMVKRDYHFMETDTGDLLWVFFDRAKQSWCQQGLVD